jgi:uncharacterized protein YjiS (DUF1127 family)
MVIGMELALLEALVDGPAESRERAFPTTAISSAWTALRSFAIRFADRRRLGRDMAHLNDRLLADVGLRPEGLGLGESLIRGSASEVFLWASDKRGRRR